MIDRLEHLFGGIKNKIKADDFFNEEETNTE